MRWRKQPFVTFFLSYRLSRFQNGVIVRLCADPSYLLAWDLEFQRDLDDPYMGELSELLVYLQIVLVPSRLYQRLLKLEPSGVFSCKS